MSNGNSPVPKFKLEYFNGKSLEIYFKDYEQIPRIRELSQTECDALSLEERIAYEAAISEFYNKFYPNLSRQFLRN